MFAEHELLDTLQYQLDPKNVYTPSTFEALTLTLTQTLKNLLLFGTFLLGTGALALYVWQSSLLYIPSLPGLPREKMISGAEVGWVDAESVIREEWIEVAEEEGGGGGTVRLHAWVIGDKGASPSTARRPVILWFHSNAGNISHRLPNIKKLLEEGLDALIVLVSYRGYGLSQGVASEAGLRADGAGSLAWLRSPTGPLAGHFDPARVFVFGRSLGTAVAIATVASTPPPPTASTPSSSSASSSPHSPPPIAGLIVENGFTSIDDMIDVLLVPMIPPLRYLKQLSVNKWPSAATISSVSTPILFISSGRDEIVPKTHMDILYEASATSSPNRVFVRFPTATHMDAYNFDGYVRTLKSFIARPFFGGGKFTV